MIQVILCNVLCSHGNFLSSFFGCNGEFKATVIVYFCWIQVLISNILTVQLPICHTKIVTLLCTSITSLANDFRFYSVILILLYRKRTVKPYLYDNNNCKHIKDLVTCSLV
jgi:hypothetical protein